MKRRKFLKSAVGAGVAATLTGFSAKPLLASDLPAEITDMSATQLSAAIRNRHVSCHEVMQAYLERIHRYNPTYNAIVSLRPDNELLAAANEADLALDRGEYRGWMHGMPHAVKDLANVRGLPTSMGSPLFEGRVADEDSFVISRIRNAGAIFVGKTNTPEFGMGSQSYNEVFGATGCAYDPSLTAGGSSGGAACGLATRMLPVADGGDMMGSLRNPAAFNNVIGFRPTFGRVPEDGKADLFYLQLAVSGPMGRNSEDTVRLLTTMAGHAGTEPLSLRDPLPDAESFRPSSIKGMKIGWLADYDGYLAMEPGILELCEKALAELSDNGAIVEPCQPNYDMARLWETWLTLRHWRRHTMYSLYQDRNMREQLKPEAIWEIEGSFDRTSTDIFDAGMARSDWFRALHALFEDYDVLVLPSAQVFPFSKDTHWPKQIAGRDMDTYHRWMEVVIGGSLGAVPVVSVPVGFDRQGRPMGMQVLGRFGADRQVLEFAMAYERVLSFLDVRPQLVASD